MSGKSKSSTILVAYKVIFLPTHHYCALPISTINSWPSLFTSPSCSFPHSLKSLYFQTETSV